MSRNALAKRATYRPEMLWRYVLSANLNDARPTILAVREKNAEIEVVGEDYPAVIAGPLHNLGVRRVAGTDDRPMSCLETVLAQKRLPVGRQIHVYKQSHAAAKGTSSSSTRQAA